MDLLVKLAEYQTMETERLILRPVSLEDTQSLFEYASNIENTVGDRLIPHVMIAQPYDLEIDYASIEDGLARMTEFLKVNEDGAYAPSAIYVTKAGDSVSSLGEDICGYNNIGSSDLINENVVLKAEDYWWFNQSTIVTIDRVNEINHTL